jgi:ABC-2 type transport system ATP-binding protein
MIEIENLHKKFGNFTAVENLNLKVARGEIFGFLGPNGAGKTTTIKILTGLLQPTSGTARIGGFDVVRQGPEAKRITSLIPDRPYLYEKLTPWEYLRFIAGCHGSRGLAPLVRHFDPPNQGRFRHPKLTCFAPPFSWAFEGSI